MGRHGFRQKLLKAKLTQQGHSVDVIDKKSNRNINNEYSFITDVKYSNVVFLAAEANLRAVRRNPVEAIKTMTSGLMNSLRFYNESHFTYISSSMVYGNWSSSSGVSESDSRAPLDLFDAPVMSSRVYNISYGRSQPLENVAKYICDKVGSGSVKIELNDFEYPQRGTMDISKAKQELGYQPTHDVYKGVDQLIQG